MKTNLDFLFEPPRLDQHFFLEFEPLAPYSMSSDMPGTYYKSDVAPNHLKVCGIVENILGMHWGDELRGELLENIARYLKKIDPKRYPAYEKSSPRSATNTPYRPLVAHLLEVSEPYVSENVMFFSDLWKMSLYRKDGYSHPNGTINLSYELLSEIALMRDENGKLPNDKIGKFYEQNRGAFPSYYSSPRLREYVSATRVVVSVRSTSGLKQRLEEALETNNMAYFGHSEGWVNVKIMENVEF